MCLCVCIQIERCDTSEGRSWTGLCQRARILIHVRFKHTTHDRTIYQAVFKGHKVLLLQQVDYLMIQTDNKDIAREIFKIIGVKLQLENEDEAPFAYLGLTADFNGEDIEQRLTS